MRAEKLPQPGRNAKPPKGYEASFAAVRYRAEAAAGFFVLFSLLGAMYVMFSGGQSAFAKEGWAFITTPHSYSIFIFHLRNFIQ